MIAWFVEAFDGIVSREEAICLHADLFVFYLHDEGGAQVDDIGVANVGELGVGESFGIFLPKGGKFGFPEKVYEWAEPCGRGYAVIVVFKMVSMEEFDVLHPGV